MTKAKKAFKIKDIFTYNAGLKVTSLVLAVILWYLVKTGFLR
ncbi:MAG: hypothetical protein PHT59_00400 [Candidatus Omnitrophica bacterium]|nr:hypothetical protein [Candidatus Omnitrophota bacterium]